MSQDYPQPRWGMLYLVLPLAGVLFWLIRRAQPQGATRSLLELGALLVIFAYVEVWRLANTVALLRHPLIGNADEPIYYVREFTTSYRAELGSRIQAVFLSDSYNDLFEAPVYVGEPSPPLLQLAGADRASEGRPATQ